MRCDDLNTRPLNLGELGQASGAELLREAPPPDDRDDSPAILESDLFGDFGDADVDKGAVLPYVPEPGVEETFLERGCKNLWMQLAGWKESRSLEQWDTFVKQLEPWHGKDLRYGTFCSGTDTGKLFLFFAFCGSGLMLKAFSPLGLRPVFPEA